jgi:CHAT domain-containing protein
MSVGLRNIILYSDRQRSHRKFEEYPTSQKLLLISQMETPNFSKIPCTKKEVEAIKMRAQASHVEALWLGEDTATVVRVKQEMQSHSWIHFACHASQSTENPLAFHLQRGPLRIADIMKEPIINADMAFLSACQTSTGDEKLPEEAVHLAAAMLAVGYRCVVATMWSIKDEHAPGVADDFYRHLLGDGTEPEEGKGLDAANTSYALHHATQCIRRRLEANCKSKEDEETALLAWVPYIHFGV